MTGHHDYRGEVPLHDHYGPEAKYAVESEALLPTTKWEEEIARGLELGLQGADSIVDKRIPTFSRGELPHFAGINTFLKAPYVEDVRKSGEYDVAVLGAPFGGGTTYRSGTRFGPQGIRKISALYGPYSFELGVDLRESITIADIGDIFTIPANIEKTFDQISKGVGHVFASGAFPVVLGGDHSIGYPTVRGVAEHLNGGKLGIIHFDRHVDTQETDLDERQGIRKISALYGPYSFELGVDLRESITIADIGDIFTIPANIEKTFDQISKGVGHVFASGAFPVVLGGDHSIGYPTVRGVAEHLNGGKLGIIHFDRHVDTQETDLDERMHTTPWFHATDIPNVPAKNLVQIGIGGWQAPRPGVRVGRERGTTVMTVTDCVEMGIEAAAERALEVAWDGADAVWLSFDVDCLDAAFVPGTGWPEPGGFLPREVLKFIHLICERPLAGIEVVECSPPYDNAEITALLATRVICDTLGCLVRAGHLPRGGSRA